MTETTSLRRLAGVYAREARYYVRSLAATRHAGTRFHCPVCNGDFARFLPVTGTCSIHGQQVDLRTENAECPRCRSGIRQRFAYELLSQRTGLVTDPMRVLHFAPDPGIYKALTRLPNVNYVAADINPTRFIKATRADITDITQPSDSFDGIICIHVLEHIEDDRRAIAELFRVTRPGGWALIAVPTYGPTTYEDVTLDYSGRERIYGTGDHLRLNGLDFANKLTEAGFLVETIAIENLPGNFADRAEHTPHTESDRYLFWCLKPQADGKPLHG
jgi:SAM-dependent methyltransferase